MFTSLRASIQRQSTAQGGAVLELQLKWGNKYCSFDHIVSEKVVDKGLLRDSFMISYEMCLIFRDFCYPRIKTNTSNLAT